ncbi:MAG: FAD/NAD(P)-binding protein [Defluviitaleaceae bacterium]|nr:FAD/NAD(P)-binding protein [Defluviitaleaceae bacterium]
MQMPDMLIPQVGIITDIIQETPDVKTFRVVDLKGNKAFDHMPGQCAMLSIPGVGEAMFSISTSPTNTKYMDFSIKRVGALTNYMHDKMNPGDHITIRGPYGNAFPVDDANALKGKNILFIGGGIALAPLRSVIHYVFDNRDDYGYVDILYGARSVADLVYHREIEKSWAEKRNTNVFLTIDRPDDAWEGNVGFVPDYFKKIGFSTDKVVVMCGPPIMIKFVLAVLLEMGFKKEQVFTTLELRMKCGIGKCGRCNIGDKFVCMDGPVFRVDELDQIPEEF